MTHVRALMALVLLPFVLIGCASSGGAGMHKDSTCAIIGAAIGAATGGILLEGEIAGALVGGGAGAVLSGLACNSGGDSDGDGVPDESDKCPGTPAGVKVDANGCGLDSDGDGVPDWKDKCHTPGAGLVDANGCLLDSDGDGVPDDNDRCPDTPAGTTVDARGCAATLDGDGDGVPNSLDKCPTTPAGWRVDSSGCASKLSLRNINFELDSAALTARSQDMLTSRVIPALQTRPGTRMRIEGHTDSTGSAQYNLGLSQRRANAVKAYLESKGIGQGRLSAVGKGEAEPAVSNKTREGRATNRRVEFHVLN